MEIKEVNKGDKVYYNIDFRDIGYGQSDEVVLLNRKPFEVDSRFGKRYLFSLLHKGKEVSAFLGDGFKTDQYKVGLHEVFMEFKRGDVLKVTKNEGHTKSGTTFRYFTVEQVGKKEETELPEMKFGDEKGSVDTKAEENVKTEEVKETPSLEIDKPKTDNPKLDLESKVDLSEWETKIYDGIKEMREFKDGELTKSQKVSLFVKNNVDYNRANEIVDSLLSN